MNTASIDEMGQWSLEFKVSAKYRWELLKMAASCTKKYDTVYSLIGAAKQLDEFINPKPLIMPKVEK